MSRKLIGIPGSSMGDNSFGANKTYLEFISKFGDPRIIMPWEDVAKVDLLLLPGGLDVNPAHYGDYPGFYTSNVDVFKDFFFSQRLDNYINAGIPIFGICLGLQQLAVKFGSKLEQNLLYHKQSSGRWETAHDVFAEKSTNYTVEKKSKLARVNSHHHQGVAITLLGGELTPLAYSDDFTDNGLLVEAFEHKSLAISAVQWHPKFFGAC